jgi:4-aminobutyrate aminotransferase
MMQMVGLEFTSAGLKAPKLGGLLAAKCLSHDLLLLTTSIYDTIRFIPPLTVSKEEMKIACEIIERSWEEVLVDVADWK